MFQLDGCVRVVVDNAPLVVCGVYSRVCRQRIRNVLLNYTVNLSEQVFDSSFIINTQRYILNVFLNIQQCWTSRHGAQKWEEKTTMETTMEKLILSLKVSFEVFNNVWEIKR